MTTETTHWYRSKVDWWLAAILCVPPLATVASCIGLATKGKEFEWIWGLPGLLIVVVVYGGLLFPLYYGLDEDHLLVRFGLCRLRIPLADVREVYPTHNPLSSPALSLDRLRVQYGPGFFKAVMISPADRDRFLDDLAKKAGLKREGDQLRRIA